MKLKLLILFLSVLCLTYINLYSQESCKVLKQEIADKYIGKCKNGLAHGKGIAEGKDKYEGKFKFGLPNGYGKYTWSNGEIYEGSWNNGKKEGDGKLFYKVNGVDSVKIGIWKNDLFFKKITPDPYSVIRESGITRYTIRRIGDGSKLMFMFYQDGRTNHRVNNLSINTNSGSSLTTGQRVGVENVIFPLKCKVTYSTPNSTGAVSLYILFEIEIKEPGDWEIAINNI